MSKLRNEDTSARRAFQPPAPAGHATDGTEPTSIAARCFRRVKVALRHTRSMLQAGGGRWVAPTRWAAGIIFLIFGIGKFADHAAELASFRHYPLPAPELFVYLVGVIEIGGGLLLTMGLLTRLAALALAADMTGAIVISGLGRGELVSLTLAPLLLVAMISLVRLGPGPWSLDRRIAPKATHGHSRQPRPYPSPLIPWAGHAKANRPPVTVLARGLSPGCRGPRPPGRASQTSCMELGKETIAIASQNPH